LTFVSLPLYSTPASSRLFSKQSRFSFCGFEVQSIARLGVGARP